MKTIRIVLLAALAAAPLAGNAAGFNLLAGPSVTASGRTTGAAFFDAYGDRPADGRVHLEPVGTLGWIGARRSTADDLDHDVFLAAGGVRIVSPGQHWFISEQIAATGNRTDALSSRFEFMTSGGWQRGHFTLILRHVSNGRIIGGGKNLGETMLLAGLRW